MINVVKFIDNNNIIIIVKITQKIIFFLTFTLFTLLSSLSVCHSVHSINKNKTKISNL